MRRRLLVVGMLASVTLAVAPTPTSAAITFFQTPARNIHCVYSSGPAPPPAEVRCDTDFPTRFRRPASCELDFGRAFAVTLRGHGRAICHGDTARDPGAKVLPGGHNRFFGRFMCTSLGRSGMHCISPARHGFLLTPGRQRVF